MIPRPRQIARHLPWFLLALALLLVFTHVRNPASLVRVWVYWAQVGILAVVLTPIILTGGIDLSVGSMVALCGMVQGVLWEHFGWPIGMATLAALATGTLAGAINGGLVVAGLSPLVATLATMALYRGAALTLTGFGSQRITGFPDSFLDWGHIAGLPAPYWMLALTVLAAYVCVHHTRFGRWCFALGDNPLAARFAAVPVTRVHCALYISSGIVSAGVAVLYLLHNQAAIPDAHKGIELQAIACVVVGGTRITGGRGGIMRSLLGLAVIANLSIGLDLLGTEFGWFAAESRLVVIGLLLIAIAIWNEYQSRTP